ncbi:MAG TPA: DUF3035 domain-containing protein [Rhizomicrobium sp.]
MHSRRIVQIALLAGFAAGLAGCDSIRDAAGGSKDAPDEFAVVTKAPLVIPPDFNLRPPAPGHAPTNQVEATQAAQNALFNSDPATVAAALPTTMSSGERYLLAYAHVQDADPSIRQQIASDVDGMRGADDSFTNNILFGSSQPSGNAPVDADAEARRLDAARAGGSATAPATTMAPPQAPPPADSDSNSDDSWLDHLWPF